MKAPYVLAAALLAAAAAGAAQAHHSYSMFDNAKVMTIKGQVTDIELAAFLNGPRGSPERQALIHLISNLVRGKD